MKITFRCDPTLIDVLPRPVPAKAALPDWLRQMAPRVPSAVSVASWLSIGEETICQCFPWRSRHSWPSPCGTIACVIAPATASAAR